MTINIVEYDEFRAKIDEIKDICNFIPDVSTKEGYEKSKRVALDVGKILTGVEKARKDAKSYWLEGGKQVDLQAKTLVEEIQEYQLPHKQAYKDLDEQKKARESERVAALESRVAYLRDMPEMIRDSSSDEILAAMNEVKSDSCEDYYEFTEQALKARNSSAEKLGQMYAAKLKAEKEASELAELRIKQAEQEKKDREAYIAREAEDRAKREAEKAVAEAKAAAEKAESDRLAEIERSRLAAEKAEADRLKAIAEAEDQKARAIEAERVRLQQEQEAIRLAEEKKAKNKAHQKRVNNQALDDLVAFGLTDEQAKDLVKAVVKGEIRNISINY